MTSPVDKFLVDAVSAARDHADEDVNEGAHTRLRVRESLANHGASRRKRFTLIAAVIASLFGSTAFAYWAGWRPPWSQPAPVAETHDDDADKVSMRLPESARGSAKRRAIDEAAIPDAGEIAAEQLTAPIVPVPVPVETKSVETKPAPVGTKAAIAETKPAPVGTKAAIAETKPAPVGTKAAIAETKSAPVGTKAAIAETKPAPVDRTTPRAHITKPAPVETKSVQTKPAPIEAKSTPIETKSVQTKPAPIEAKPAPVETKSVQTKPALVEAKPAPVETKSVQTKPAPVEAKPTPVEAKSVQTKPAPVEAKPTPIETKSVQTKPAPVETKPAPVDTKSAPRVTNQAPRVESQPSAELASYRNAHNLHFRGNDPKAALAAWDAYLAKYPNGSLVPEARYDRAMVLVKLARWSEARAALAPIANAKLGAYRQKAAEILAAIKDR